MKFTILTLFPEMFPGPLGYSLAGKALERGLWSYDCVDIRSFADVDSIHKSVDDTPYGGGAGMVMRPDVVGNAVDSLKKSAVKNSNQKIIYPSPRGKPLNQRVVEDFGNLDSLIILCGRYEGLDQRVIEEYDIEEVSVGDYILSGGEIAAITIIDACIRKINGVIGNANTHSEESFASGEFENLLEYPLYTRPDVWNGRNVPDVLKSGNHGEIERWRKARAKEITKERRPDLWAKFLKEKEND